MANQGRTANNRKSKKTPSRKQTRKRNGIAGTGEYYHIEVLPKADFVTFQTEDIGRRGHIQRVAGQRSSGYWSTVKWLIDKDDAHIQDNKLVPDTKDAQAVIEQLGSEPVRMLGDRFKARPLPNYQQEIKSTLSRSRSRRESTKSTSTRRKN